MLYNNVCVFRSANKDNENRKITECYGQKICEAIEAYNKDNYSTCFELLYPIRQQIYQIGGSNAQRDVFTQFLLNSAVKSKEHKNEVL